MTEKPPRRPEIPLIQLVPNMLTIAAICAGLSAIRFGIQGDFTLAVKLILAACVLDGLDGRLARAMAADSAIGAELDSLADFLNFGVAPPLVIYFWGLQSHTSIGWISVLIFATCCVLRLARFNVGTKSETKGKDDAYFVGVPAPASAMLAMLPMFLSFAFIGAPILHPVGISLYLAVIGLLMISRIPTWSFKTTTISRRNVKAFLVAVAFVGASVLTFAWVTLVALCIGYVAVVIWALVTKPRAAPSKDT
ncbi:CDP-diacylglycerol--serine O-phosphatidyltransferase [Roseivivax halodurans JCM 10272]|uniref:CDP-diacylglycerol--serine O-phosphatidyltransferase n=1 Tax=Roseivivax halodurans JCM 10272 TaxID=1449350 RepID=X7EES1_9RHOB|nr:CDP-diacylglycerol--serine O-phosphatidyltransferase [Roseivivax halodurans]ETX13721.1 CDP-diacylglycerol--serine O-phosphatidyltransferase [Roseivivax halodurans JCM 10272]